MSNAKYILQDKTETTRLTEQFNLRWYHAKNEQEFFEIPEMGSLLDIGCGSGAYLKYLKENKPNLNLFGCDLTPPSDLKNIEVFKCNVLKDKLPRKYNIITNRLVPHHLAVDGFKKLAKNAYDSLVDNGAFYISDVDGLLLSIGTTNSFVLDCLKKIQQHFHGDSYTARYIPSIISDIGFKDVEYKIILDDFSDYEEKKLEASMWRERLMNSKEFYIGAIGSAELFSKFVDEYVSEFARPDVVVFNNKILAKGFKR